MKKGILYNITILFGVFVLFSCDSEYSTIGANLVDDDHFDFELNEDILLNAYSQATGPVQTNNLTVLGLGEFNDEFFGQTKASFVTQLQLPTLAPDFGTAITIEPTDSVYLYIPYFSTVETLATGNEASTYTLDSIYGDIDTVLDLRVVENNYTLNDFDPTDNNQTVQKYYSDQKSLVSTVSTGPVLNNDIDDSQNSNFKIVNTEIIKYKTNGSGAYLDSEGEVTTNSEEYVVEERKAPGIYVNLDKTFFRNKVLQASTAQLSNNTNFKNHFKGLFIEANTVSGGGVMPLISLTNAEIVIQYHSLLNGETEKRQTKLNLAGTNVSFYDNTPLAGYTNGLAAQSTTLGSDRLYLKGNEGSHAIIDLFGADADNNGVADQLEELRAQELLINDATITFFIARDDLNGAEEAKRIYLYDATNQTTILDYNADTTSSSSTYGVKTTYGGVLTVNANEEGVYYKIRIAEHLNRVINGTDSNTNTNIKLGLSVTDNVAINLMSDIKTPVDSEITKVPYASVICPRGTILYGSAEPDEDKRLKVKLYYTKEK